jgi:hypothetical protein
LILASGELEVDSLPFLAALPYLEYLELARCTPCRRRRRAGSAGGTGGGYYARASAGTAGGFGRISGGAGVAGTSMARPSCASSEGFCGGADGEGEERRPSGKRALLELCLTAPLLRRVLVVRCTGLVCRAEGAEGPLGAEWVRQRLLAMGPRGSVTAAGGPGTISEDSTPTVTAPAAPASVAGSRGLLGRGSLGRLSLNRVSRRSVVRVSEADLGWPEVVWD